MNMSSMELMRARHSVRQYKDIALRTDVLTPLQEQVDICNQESGLHIQLVANDPKAFDGFMAHYGKFSGVKNYVALIGPSGADLDEKLGYYGERIVLKAQELGLNTCWVAMTFGKGAARKKCVIAPGEKLVCVLALGYGETQGVPHKSKDMTALCSYAGEMPDWFRSGMEATMLAPTAMNQQKFLLTLTGEKTVTAKNLGGFYSKIDFGIVKYHFEQGAGKDSFSWGE